MFQRFAALAACVLSVAALAASQQPVFRGGSETVRVFVTVTDRDGRLVTDLTQDDFEIRDEGKPQPIEQFDNTPQPIRLITMLDISGSMHGNLPLLRSASEELFARLRPEDVARLGTFGEKIAITPADFTRDLPSLEQALPQSIPESAPTPLWHALDEAIGAFGTNRDERAVVLVLSDGKDSGMIGFNKGYYTEAQVIERARKESVMIYAVGMRSREAHKTLPPAFGGVGGLRAMMGADLPDPGLGRVAGESGGGYTEINYGEDLGTEFTRVADELHSQYLLGYTPPKRDGKIHKIEVRLKKHGLEARARKSYLAPKE